MSFLDKNGLQVLTTKLVQGDAIKVASHRGHTVKNVIDNITRECENISTPNTMAIENGVNDFKVGKGRDLDVSGDVEEGKIEVGLSGRTYQNLVKENSKYTQELNTKNHTGYIEPNFTLKPTGTYTLFFKVSNLVKSGNARVNCIFRGNDNDNTYGQFAGVDVVEDGLNRKMFTLKNGLKNFLIGISASANKNNPTFTIGDIMILEGDHTQTPIEELPKYFEGIKSSFEDGIVDVEVQGKNLLNIKHKTLEAQGLIIEANEEKQQFIVNGSATGDVYVYFCGETWKSELNDIITNTNYSLTILTDGDVDVKSDRKDLLHVQMGYKDENNVSKSYFDKRITQLGEVKCGLFRTGDYRITSPWFRLDKGNVYKNFVIKLQIQHQANTSYEPYYKKKISFNIGEPLRSLPNGVCDEIRNNNGQWELVRRTFKKIVNSNNNWNVDGASSNNRIRCHCGDLIDVIPNSSTYCDKLSYLYPPTYNCENTTRSGSGYFELILNGTTKEEFLTRLNQLGDLEVIYELKTPIITPIEPIEFEVKPLATMTINSEIAPTSNHKVILNRAGQIEQGIVQIAELKSRVDSLETAYDSYLLETQHKLSILGFEYELESEEV